MDTLELEIGYFLTVSSRVLAALRTDPTHLDRWTDYEELHAFATNTDYAALRRRCLWLLDQFPKSIRQTAGRR